jgi:hypothetical protein
MLDDNSSSELKPYRILMHKLSTPPTSTASTRPWLIHLAADAKTFALDEQAVLIVIDGPSSPVAAETKAPGACRL